MTCAVDGCDAGLRSDNQSGRCYTHRHRGERKVKGFREPAKRIKENLTYRSAHKRIWRERGKASEQGCITGCGNMATGWAYFGPVVGAQYGETDLGSGQFAIWSSEPEDYSPLCTACHKRLDVVTNNTLAFSLLKANWHAEVLGHQLAKPIHELLDRLNP